MRTTSWKSLMVASLLLLGAGCTSPNAVTTPNTATNTDTNTSITTTPEVPSEPVVLTECPKGTVRFIAETMNVSFCYPPLRDDGASIAIEEKTDGVILKADGVVVRKVAMLPRTAGKTEQEEVRAYIKAGTPNGIFCDITNVSGMNTKSMSYIVSGTDATGTQTLEAIDACGAKDQVMQLLENLGQPVYIFVPGATSFYVLSGEQEAQLGYAHTYDFTSSIGPKE